MSSPQPPAFPDHSHTCKRPPTTRNGRPISAFHGARARKCTPDCPSEDLTLRPWHPRHYVLTILSALKFFLLPLPRRAPFGLVSPSVNGL